MRRVLMRVVEGGLLNGAGLYVMTRGTGGVALAGMLIALVGAYKIIHEGTQ